jgi:signal transduction histidine kinase
MPATPPAQAPRGHARWLAFAAVIVPLAVLLLLQFRTLARLQETSAAAHQLALKGYARTVLRTAEAFYRLKADDALQVPVELLDAAQRDALAAYFAGRDSRGVKRFFVVPFGAGVEAALFFGPDGRPIDARRDAAETRAARFAAAPWQLAASEATAMGSPAPVVDEQDPDNRVILRPIVGADSRVRGVAGLILDTAYFRDRYVPELLRAENGLIPAPLRDHVAVSVSRRPGNRVPTLAPGADIDAPFRFAFTDWRLSVRNPSLTPAQWERWSFLTNLAVSLGLGAVLLGAVLLALRSAARATQLSQMKTEFVSSVSHELRTPLASIRVFGEFLRLGRVSGPEKVREYGEYIEAESRRLTQLVNNILDFSKIESGQKRYHLERADIAQIVAETLRTFEVRLKQDGFVVDLRASPTPLPPAWVDPPAIGQVLTNLLDNAIKYSGDGRHIGVTLGRQNGFVTLAVSDQGPGIPVAEQQRIFEKFYRVGNGLVHDAKGSGLGLAIVKHIVEAHRGRVVVDSRPGAGATFTVELPIHAG